MSTRAKFICQSIEDRKYAGSKSTKITFTAATAYNSPEDKPFWEATPVGLIELSTVNEAAIKQFEPGKAYFVDFTAADN
jgi:hypothetical protein